MPAGVERGLYEPVTTISSTPSAPLPLLLPPPISCTASGFSVAFIAVPTPAATRRPVVLTVW